MQTATVRIWTWVGASISYDNNRYAKRVFIYIYVCMYVCMYYLVQLNRSWE